MGEAFCLCSEQGARCGNRKKCPKWDVHGSDCVLMCLDVRRPRDTDVRHPALASLGVVSGQEPAGRMHGSSGGSAPWEAHQQIKSSLNSSCASECRQSTHLRPARNGKPDHSPFFLSMPNACRSSRCPLESRRTAPYTYTYRYRQAHRIGGREDGVWGIKPRPAGGIAMEAVSDDSAVKPRRKRPRPPS